MRSPPQLSIRGNNDATDERHVRKLVSMIATIPRRGIFQVRDFINAHVIHENIHIGSVLSLRCRVGFGQIKAQSFSFALDHRAANGGIGFLSSSSARLAAVRNINNERPRRRVAVGNGKPDHLSVGTAEQERVYFRLRFKVDIARTVTSIH